MLTSVNQARQQAGKGPLCLSTALMQSALTQSQYQASKDQMTHDNPVPLMTRFTNVGFQAQGVAENVAETGSTDVNAVMTAWLNSAEHKANILGDYTHLGVAAAPSASGKIYWTQHFGKSSSATEPCSDGSPAPAAGSTPQSTSSAIPSAPAPTAGGASPSGGGTPPTDLGLGPGSSPAPQPTDQLTPQGPAQPTGAMPQQLDSLMSAALGGPGMVQPTGAPTASPDDTMMGGGDHYTGQQPPPSSGAPGRGLQFTKRFICLRNTCYRIVKTVLGEGFIPDPFRPSGVDISVGPVLI